MERKKEKELVSQGFYEESLFCFHIRTKIKCFTYSINIKLVRSFDQIRPV